jgi:hypothetical protein
MLDVALAGEGVFDGVFDGVTPLESVAEGVDESVEVVLGVCDLDVDDVGVGELVSEVVPVGVGVVGGVTVALLLVLTVAEPESDTVLVELGLAR